MNYYSKIMSRYYFYELFIKNNAKNKWEFFKIKIIIKI